jgi:membrane protease YdiL (CAAX protease family)
MILLLVLALGLVLIPFEDSVQRPGGFLLFFSVLQFACFFLIPLYVVGVRHRQPLQALGIQEKPLIRGLGKGLLWGIVLFSLFILAARLQLMFFPEQPQETQTVIQAMLDESNAFELFGLVFSVIVLAPVGEEIFFRAFMMGALEARFGRLVGVVISSLVFAALHESLWNIFPMFVGGCGFALLYTKYRDISLNITAHAVWNSIVIFLVFGMSG